MGANMLARIDTWIFGDIRKDMFGRWCLHYGHNDTRCKRLLHCPINRRPIGQEVLDVAAEIIGRRLSRCEETDILDLVEIK